MTKLNTKTIKILENKVNITNLDYICEVKQGLATADNKFYVYKTKDAFGPYKILDSTKLLSSEEIKKIVTTDIVREKIIPNGIPKTMFKGKTIVPFDKGGGSDVDEKRLSNYFYPSKYFIDWSEENVLRMKTITIGNIKKAYAKKNIKKLDYEKIGSRFQNIEYNFKKGITFPMVGTPIFKLNSMAIFDHGGNCLFVKEPFKKYFSYEYVLGILCTKLNTYILKNFINNTVNTQVDDIKKIPIPLCKSKEKKKIEELVSNIINEQKKDLAYSYHMKEQCEIESLVYEIFGLNDELISEVELWYQRKYPHLK